MKEEECANTLGVMHGFWFWFILFFGLFSKDASVVIGLFSPRTQVFRCNNVSYRLRIKIICLRRSCVILDRYPQNA